MRPEYSPAFVARFWAKVDRSGGPDACWPWRGSMSGNGYGLMRQRRREGRMSVGAHRVAFEIAYGQILPTFLVCHRCPGGERRDCVNPAHLSVGLVADNNHDMIRAGRYRGWLDSEVVRGERHGGARLTDDDVRAIRQAAANGTRLKDLAITYDLHPSAIGRIVARKRWQHLD